MHDEGLAVAVQTVLNLDCNVPVTESRSLGQSHHSGGWIQDREGAAVAAGTGDAPLVAGLPDRGRSRADDAAGDLACTDAALNEIDTGDLLGVNDMHCVVKRPDRAHAGLGYGNGDRVVASWRDAVLEEEGVIVMFDVEVPRGVVYRPGGNAPAVAEAGGQDVGRAEPIAARVVVKERVRTDHDQTRRQDGYRDAQRRGGAVQVRHPNRDGIVPRGQRRIGFDCAIGAVDVEIVARVAGKVPSVRPGPAIGHGVQDGIGRPGLFEGVHRPDCAGNGQGGRRGQQRHRDQEYHHGELPTRPRYPSQVCGSRICSHACQSICSSHTSHSYLAPTPVLHLALPRWLRSSASADL